MCLCLGKEEEDTTSHPSGRLEFSFHLPLFITAKRNARDLAEGWESAPCPLWAGLAPCFTSMLRSGGITGYTDLQIASTSLTVTMRDINFEDEFGEKNDRNPSLLLED